MKNYLSVRSDGTAFGTKVFCPDGSEVMIKSIVLGVTARELEQATMVFYLTQNLHIRLTGSKELDGLFFENGDRMDGLVRLEAEPLDNQSGDTATAVFYPKGSKGAPEDETPIIHPAARDFAGPGPVIVEVRRILNAGPQEGTTAAAARVVREWKGCLEELDVDGCAKWENERREIIEALDALGAVTHAPSVPAGVHIQPLSIVGRIRALAASKIENKMVLRMPDVTEFLGRPIQFWQDVRAVLRTLTTRPGDELEMLKQVVRQNMSRGAQLAEMTRELQRAGKERERYTERILAMLRDTARAAGYDPDEATHGEEMVAGTIKAIKALRDCTEHAWAIIANAGGGEWAKEGEEWQAGAIAWRETFTKLQSAFVALNPREREVPGASHEVATDCGHETVWLIHQMPDPGDETSEIQHARCVQCNRLVHRWATDNNSGQWCVGAGETLTLPRDGFLAPVLLHASQGKA